MTDREKVIKGLECCMSEKICNSPCPYKGQCDDGGYYFSKAIEDAIDLLKAQEPQILTLEEVEALPYGYVLIETDKKDSLHWVDALLFCKNTNFSFDFITLEGRARLLGSTYNMEWRCWTSRPTDEQRKAEKWNEQ